MIYGMEFKLHGFSEILHNYKRVKMNENEFFYVQTFHNLDQSQLVFFVGRTYILSWGISYVASSYICIFKKK